MSKSISSEPADFEFVYSDDCSPEIEDDWYLVEINTEEFPAHGTHCTSPLDSSKIKEEDDFILSYVSVLRESEEEEIKTEWSVERNPDIIGCPTIFKNANDVPFNSIEEGIGLTNGTDKTRNASWNPTVEEVGSRKDIPEIEDDHFNHAVDFEGLMMDVPLQFTLDDYSIDWDEYAFYEESPVDVSPKLDQHVDTYITGRYKKGRKCDLFSGRFSKRLRKKLNPDCY